MSNQRISIARVFYAGERFAFFIMLAGIAGRVVSEFPSTETMLALMLAWLLLQMILRLFKAHESCPK